MYKKRTIYVFILAILIAVIFILIYLVNQKEERKFAADGQIEIAPKTQMQEAQTEPEPERQPESESEKATSALISYLSEYNFAQTYNDCAPYNAAAVVRALTGTNVSSAEFARTISYRMEYNWTLPEGIIKQLNQNDISTLIPDLSAINDLEKIEYLRDRLLQKHPVILLVKKEDFQHYITIFGFDSTKDEFYIYDSLMERLEGGLTKDENSDMPGNKTLTTAELLKAWSGGELKGKYNWYAIVCSY
ncbi:C39 family peptidase [Candidatus Peregrinibacteria bacterium]|nr:C39 family peptidase [Candidatus Peregrinibacteria bacterium]